MNITVIDSHRANKRQAFDGMCAYHQSELAHKKDGIEILQTILSSTPLIYGALIGILLTGKKMQDFVVLTFTYALFGVIALAVIGAVSATNAKIAQDNSRYRKYQDEYQGRTNRLKP